MRHLTPRDQAPQRIGLNAVVMAQIGADLFSRSTQDSVHQQIWKGVQNAPRALEWSARIIPRPHPWLGQAEHAARQRTLQARGAA